MNLGTFQKLVDASDKNKPAFITAKALWSKMFEYAIKNELLPPERKAIIQNIDISAKGNPNKIERKIFGRGEIATLWENVSDPDCRLVLLLIYTGVRVSELFNLTKEDVNFKEQYFSIKEAKTKAGVRQVPIADKILPFMKNYPFGDLYYSKFSPYHWHPCMDRYNMVHTPHDTRHTFISLMTEKEVDARIIKAIVGHAGSGVTEAVYTHIPVHRLLEAVNQLD